MDNLVEWKQWNFIDEQGKEREIFIPDPESTEEDLEHFWGLLKHAQEVFEDDGFAEEIKEDDLAFSAAALAAPVIVEVLFRLWVEEMETLASPPRKGAAHYEVIEEEEEKVTVQLRPEGFNWEAAGEALQSAVLSIIEPERAAQYIVTHSLAWTWMESEVPYEDDPEAMQERMMHATALYADHIAVPCLEAIDTLLEEIKTQEGRIYRLERLLHIREGGWPEVTGDPSGAAIRARVLEHLERLEFDKVERWTKVTREREKEARRANRWTTAARLRQTREVIQYEKTRFLFGANGSLNKKADAFQKPDKGNESKTGGKILDEDLRETLRLTIDELERQPRATNFINDICGAVAKRLTDNCDPVEKYGVRDRLEDIITPRLRREYPDFNIPRGASIREWQRAKGDLKKALEKWEK